MFIYNLHISQKNSSAPIWDKKGIFPKSLCYSSRQPHFQITKLSTTFLFTFDCFLAVFLYQSGKHKEIKCFIWLIYLQLTNQSTNIIFYSSTLVLKSNCLDKQITIHPTICVWFSFQES